MSTAPLYRDALTLAAVLLEALEEGDSYTSLRARLTHGALTVVDRVAQALGGHDRPGSLTDADAELCALRARLALAHHLGLLGDDTFTGLVACADVIGRQIGGWQRRLDRGALAPA